MRKKVLFLLPCISKGPAGGYKVVYQYADYLAQEGYDVHIAYPYILNLDGKSLLFRIKAFLKFTIKKVIKTIPKENWYCFKQNVCKDYVFSFNNCSLTNSYKDSVVFATAVETAYALNKMSFTDNKNKFYLIQDFENWYNNTDEYVYNSYTFPFTKIVIASWLKKKVEQTGNNAVLIPNGLDFNYFKLSVPIERRVPTEVAMLYHLDDRKRCCDSMAALEIVKKQIPGLHVTMFGIPEKPETLPEWYTYYQMPDKETHNRIYNNAAIFVAASMKEGWALPPAEAMMCGAALVCTDIDGFKDYAFHNETAMLSKVYDVEALAKNILCLINDNELRIRIAVNGCKNIQKYTWQKSFEALKRLMENL